MCISRRNTNTLTQRPSRAILPTTVPSTLFIQASFIRRLFLSPMLGHLNQLAHLYFGYVPCEQMALHGRIRQICFIDPMSLVNSSNLYFSKFSLAFPRYFHCYLLEKIFSYINSFVPCEQLDFPRHLNIHVSYPKDIFTIQIFYRDPETVMFLVC